MANKIEIQPPILQGPTVLGCGSGDSTVAKTPQATTGSATASIPCPAGSRVGGHLGGDCHAHGFGSRVVGFADFLAPDGE